MDCNVGPFLLYIDEGNQHPPDNVGIAILVTK